MEKETLEADYDSVMATYYGEEQVTALIMVKVETRMVERFAAEVTESEDVEDVFLVTGDTDIVVKARFSSYKELKHFVLRELAKLEGIKETKTLMVVSMYKEKGVKK
ncbi:MAG: Lrp/AsnC family transcriptional regulator [Thermoplasmatota archaeon]